MILGFKKSALSMYYWKYRVAFSCLGLICISWFEITEWICAAVKHYVYKFGQKCLFLVKMGIFHVKKGFEEIFFKTLPGLVLTFCDQSYM